MRVNKFITIFILFLFINLVLSIQVRAISQSDNTSVSINAKPELHKSEVLTDMEYFKNNGYNMTNILGNNKNQYVSISTYSYTRTAIFTTDEPGMNGENTAIKIQNSQYDDARFIYNFRALDANSFYEVSAYVKLEDIDLADNSEYGATVGEENEWACSYNLTQINQNWVKLKVVARTTINGTLGINFRLGYWGSYAKGTVLFDDISIKRVENNEDYVLSKSDDSTVRMVFNKQDVVQSGITQIRLKEWANKLVEVGNEYTDLVGMQVLNGKIDIIATNYYNSAALYAGDPIQWMQPGVVSELRRLSNSTSVDENCSFGVLHEISHNYDLGGRWNFDAEFWANTKMVYALEQLNIGVLGNNNTYIGADIKEYYKLKYQERSLDNGIYTNDGLTYRFLCIKDELVGWDAFKKTFRWFNSIDENDVPQTNLQKFITYIQKLTQYSGKDVKSMFTINEWNTIIEHFENDTEIINIYIQDTNMYNAIRDAISNKLQSFNNGTQKLTIQWGNLKTINELQLSNKSISNVNGIDKFINLEVLNLSNNQIIDIESISNLTNLSTLNLSNNNIKDIMYIEDLVIRNLNINNQSIAEQVIDNTKQLQIVNLPKIFIQAKTLGHIGYTPEEFTLTDNCVLIDKNTRIQVRLENEPTQAILTINGGILDGSKLIVSLPALYQIDDTITSEIYVIDNENMYITRIPANTTVEELLNNVTSQASIIIYDKNQNIITDDIDKLITTNSKLKVGEKIYTLAVIGDLDENGQLNTVDLSKIKRHVIEIINLENIYIKAADMNNDGLVNLVDLSLLKRAIIGL